MKDLIIRTARGLGVGLIFIVILAGIGLFTGRLTWPVVMAVGVSGTAAIAWAAR